MSEFVFWREWRLVEKIPFTLLGILLLATGLISIVLNVEDYTGVFEWNISASLNYVQVPLYSDHSKVLEASIDELVPLAIQKSDGNFVLGDHTFTYLFASLVYLFLAFAVAIVSSLSRFWFIVGMGLLVLFFALGGTGQLSIFGLSREFSIAIPSLSTIVLAYYFQAVKTDIRLVVRWLLVVFWFVVLTLVIHFFSESSTPITMLSYQSYWMALIFTIVFSLMVGHEIVYGILVLTTLNSNDRSNTNGLHFVFFSLIYLLNVAMVYMYNSGYINWDFYYFNPFLLLFISSLLGVWGLKHRAFMFEGIIPFRSLAIYGYLSLTVLSFVSIAYFQFLGNDMTMEVLEDAVIFGHMAFGGMFFIYIIVNFVNLLLKGLPIYRVAFKEDNFPYATSKIAGLIVVGAFFFASNYAPLNQAIAGFFNHTGDFKLIEGRLAEAKEAYRKSSVYGNNRGESNNGHRSNFMYATLEDDLGKKLTGLKNSTEKNPSPQSFASLGLAYERNARVFDAMFVYQQGLEVFPESWALQNNLAMLYMRMDVLDSANYYLGLKNDGNEWQQEILRANRFALNAQVGQADQVIAGDRLDVQANELANIVIYDKDVSYQDRISSLPSTLNLVSFAYLKNLGLYCAKSKDGRFLSRIDDFLNNSANSDYQFDLTLVKAYNLYELGQVKDAFEVLNDLYSRTSVPESIIPMILGKWSMELGAIQLASTYFETARENAYPLATADLVQAYARMGDQSVATYLWGKELAGLDSVAKKKAKSFEALSEALIEGTNTWTNGNYTFQREEELLSQAQAVDLDTAALRRIYHDLGTNNPFFESGVLASAEYFNLHEDQDQAYGILLDAITVNTYSATLIKSYIDQCLAMGLVNYAESTVIRLIDILEQEEYQAYELAFEEKKEAALAALDSW